jgi:hypothetical protein
MTSGGPHASLHKVRPAGRFTKGQSVAPAGGNTEFHGYHYRERTADVAATITDCTRPMVLHQQAMLVSILNVPSRQFGTAECCSVRKSARKGWLM